MNLAEIKNRLALLEGGGLDSNNVAVPGITGIKRAYAQGPSSLPESDFPLFINFTGPTRNVQHLGGTLYQESRLFNCRLYVTPVLSGIDGEAERKVEPFIELCEKRFLQIASLSDGNPEDLITGIQKIEYLGDSGISVLLYAKVQYLGVEFRLAIDAVIEQEPGKYD